MSSCHSITKSHQDSIMSSCHSITISHQDSIMSSCHSIMSGSHSISMINYVFLSFDFVCLLFNYIFLSRVEGRGTEHVTVNSIFDMKTASYLMCWIGRITGTYSDVNEENVIQTCCTDNMLRPKKSLKWPVSQFHLAHYSSTNVCLKN